MFGYNQKLQNVTQQRSSNVNYINNTSLPIIIMITESGSGDDYVYIDDILVMNTVSAINVDVPLTFIVPPNSKYRYSGGFSKWFEYR